MSIEICRCCAGKMTASSPRNPNICVSCEQLLEDDCMELDALLAGAVEPGRGKLPAEHTQDVAVSEPQDTFSSPI